ncbi:unnamed protein product [Arabidopsis arenosa]|uniref:AAA-type ATPase N-terminal domain-containing protein n=1 Tax=Arabidopsis arenosa TaxID=38785 RepID=A0A8S2AWH5_ARAAE|nr:unnamed protein product [Arabidopsis arenosa]
MSNKLPTIPRIHFEPRWHPYIAINTYLGSKATDKAKNLRASQMRDSKVLDLKRDETTVSDEYEGSKVWWKIMTDANGKKSYRLTFHNRARSVVTGSYIQYVVDEGKSIEEKKPEDKDWKCQGETMHH